MPEGDSVHRVAARLHRALAGRPLLAAELRVPRYATSDLVGREVHEVVPRGKHLLVRLGGGLTVHTHLRMDGAFRLFGPGEPWRGGPAHEIRLVLGNRDATAVGYRLPVLDLVPTADEARVVGHLGPDVLGDWDLQVALDRLRGDLDREIGSALLDQRNLAGLGNIYRTEALFVRGVDPWTRVRDVRDLPALVETARRLIAAGLGPAGAARRREARHVYGRARRPCRRCGTVIRSAMQGEPGRERVTAWCPHCQPASGQAARSTTVPSAGTRAGSGRGSGLTAAPASSSSRNARSSLTSRSTSESGADSASQIDPSSSEEASLRPRSTSER